MLNKTIKNNKTYTIVNNGKTKTFTKIPSKLTLLNILAHIGNKTKFVETENDTAFANASGILILVNNLLKNGANETIAKTHKNDN